MKQKLVAESYLKAVSKFKKGTNGRRQLSLSPSPALLSPLHSNGPAYNTAMLFDNQIQDTPDLVDAVDAADLQDQESAEIPEDEPRDEEEEQYVEEDQELEEESQN